MYNNPKRLLAYRYINGLADFRPVILNRGSQGRIRPSTILPAALVNAVEKILFWLKHNLNAL